MRRLIAWFCDLLRDNRKADEVYTTLMDDGFTATSPAMTECTLHTITGPLTATFPGQIGGVPGSDAGPDGGCTIPPPNWWCTRPAGHEGPCAAVPNPHYLVTSVGDVKIVDTPEASDDFQEDTTTKVVFGHVKFVPKRIQRKRVKSWRSPPCTVYVGRPTIWSNPWAIGEPYPGSHLGRVMTAQDAVDHFRDHSLIAKNHTFIKRKLRGMNLSCWCALDRPCHADILLAIANEED